MTKAKAKAKEKAKEKEKEIMTADKLTHVDVSGRPRMVDVSDKKISRRQAKARAEVRLPPAVLAAVTAGNGEIMTSKGAVFQTARIAGITGVKKTADLIPFCHPLAIEKCSVEIELIDDLALIDCTVALHGRTGVEMEALTGAAIAALTVYDMCKALSHEIRIESVRLLEKTGGKSDFSSG